MTSEATAKPTHRRRPIGRPTAAVVAAPCLTGGRLFGGETTVKRTGNDVPAAAFDQVQPGTTTLARVHAALGEPSAKGKPTPADEVWRYDYTEHVDSNGYVLFVFGGSDSTETTRKAVVEFKDGLVVRKWRG